ncbi:Ca-activated chloride channel family protein [Dyella sp. OK004]|uniref:VWA domain-containing protein n=1 Tax=Dyella sp. OK004 TaxID=1855292 RepID=UPI0008E957AA|nr:VWA domain-containing protein [Dyella sp. OK004]SFR90793.1 Ca-activated chloride channel family protein [Dyella sp. OK004]
MSEFWNQFHFLRPWWLLALLAVPVLWALAARGSQAQRELSRLVDPELLPHLLQGRAGHRRLPPLLLALGWALCALALAGPTWSRVASPLYANRAAQVIAISLSQHMLSKDVAPSRLDRARYKARDLLAANRDGLNGLIAYAGEAFVVAPLTSDASSLDDLLDALSPDTMPTDGNDAAQAIQRGVALIRDAKAGGGSVVLMTDSADAAAAAAARKARAEGVNVSVLAVGTTQGGPVPMGDGGLLRGEHGDVVLAQRDDASLQAVAEAGGGRFVPMSDNNTDIEALRPSARAAGQGALASGLVSDQWQDRGPWLLLPLLPIVALAFRRGWLLLLALILLPALPDTAQASTWSDLWRRPDQQAAQALRQGQAKQAQQLAHDPALRGVAAYRAGDYSAAAQALQDAAGPDAAYNLGNALAKQGHYQDALAAYDRALKSSPANEDAKANRKAVEDWMRKQPPQPPENKQGGKDKSAKDKSDKGDDQSSSQPKNGEQGQKPSSGEQGEGQSGKQGQPSDQSHDPSGKGKDEAQPAGASSSGAAKPMSAQEQAEQQARTEQAKQALQQQMDRALQAQGKAADKKDSSHELGAVAADGPQAKLPADVRRALQRVPDDPGALLRRKFELEYRQRHGASAGEGD